METFRGYIYKLTGSCGKVYIGSTIRKELREKQHNSKSNNTSSKLLLKPMVFEVIDTRDYILIKSLRLVEQFYLENINNINCKRAYTQRRKRKNNKEYQILYREKNKEKLSEYNRLYIERNKEKYKEYHRLYIERNKEKYKDYIEKEIKKK
jgi:hypothetical protein